MNKNKADPRAYIAMNMLGDLFLRSISRFSPTSKLPKLTEVDERLKQRALQAIQSKSPQDRKISVTKVSQLGPGNLWKGLDLAPQRTMRQPENQQRLQTSVKQSYLTPQQGRYQTLEINRKNQEQPQTPNNQNSPKKAIQRHHNRAAQNNMNDSRGRIQTRQVTGNMVSQNLARNQKSVKDDFQIAEKSADKKRKFSNQNGSMLNVQNNERNANRSMTQSRAFYENKEKRVSFSPEKPKEHMIQRNQTHQVKKPVQPKPTLIVNTKVVNSKQQPYVYVPPAKRVTTKSPMQEDKVSGTKIDKTQQAKQDTKSPSFQPLSPPKVQMQKQSQTVPVNSRATNQPSEVKNKPKQDPATEQQKYKKPSLTSPTSATSYVYQPPMRNAIKVEQKKEEKLPQNTQSQQGQKSPKKVGFNVPSTSQKNISPIPQSFKTPQKVIPNRTVPAQHNIEVKRTTQIVKTPRPNVQNSNVSLDVSSKSKSPQRVQTNRNNLSRNKVEVSAEEMKKDWSKIKQNLKYDKSYSPSVKSGRKVPQREDIAMKMLAQLFLDASTRYFPGLSMLLKRGISKEQIERIRSKSSQFKININSSERKSPSKQQPKTQRKLNWKQSQVNRSKQSQNNRMYQADVTAVQYKMKRPDEVEAVKNRAQQSGIQQRAKPTNIVSESLEKNNGRLTRDDSNLGKNNKSLSQKSNSIRESPDVYKRQTSKKDADESKRDLAKMKSEASKQQYVYQPPVKRQQRDDLPSPTVQSQNQIKTPIQSPNASRLNNQKPDNNSGKPKQDSSKQLTQSKSQTSIHLQNSNATQNGRFNQGGKPQVEEKKNVNYGQNSGKNLQNKQVSRPQLTKPDSKDSPQNMSIVSSKSQTSINQPSQVKNAYNQPGKPQQKQPNSGQYIYQPSNRNAHNTGTQPNIPAKETNSQTLRSVQSQKTIKQINDIKDNTPQSAMAKKQQRVSNGNVEKTQEKSFKEPTLLSKRFCTIIALLLKKRLNLNFSYSLHKIKQKAIKQTQISKHASYLARSTLNFTQNYRTVLLRNAFNLIKSNILTSVNKILKESKPVQEKELFSSGRKQSASRLIFWLLKNKISSYLQPLRQIYFNIQNKGKTKQVVIQSLVRVISKKQIIYTKAAFKSIRKYKNQRQAVLQNFAALLGKIKHSAVQQHFSNFVNKDIKQLGITVQKQKQTGGKQGPLNEGQRALQKSRSQQVLPSTKTIKQDLGSSQEGVKLSAADEAKLQAKRKQFERKANELERKKESLQQQMNGLNKQKRVKTKKNGDLKIKIKELDKQIDNQEVVQSPKPQKAKSSENKASESQIVTVLTRIYAYLFEDTQNGQIVVQRFLSDNQHCFQLPTNPALLNEWKVINKNAELKRMIKLYEGEQPREKKIAEVLQEENSLMAKLLRSFVRERYIWEWVNIIAHQ